MEEEESIKVGVTERLYAGGRVSFRVEIRSKDGRRVRKSVGAIVKDKPRTVAERAAKRAAKEQAEAAAAQIKLQIRNGEFRWEDTKAAPRSASTLADLIEEYASRAKTKNTRGNYKLLKKHVQQYRNIEIKRANTDYVRGFLSYLSDVKNETTGGRLSDGTRKLLLVCLGTVLRLATKRRYISEDPTMKLEADERPKGAQSKQIKYLTAEEVQALAKTPCKNEMVKAAFLFACACGLRLSDIIGLQWEEIQDRGGCKFIVKKQQKTGRVVEIPLKETALHYLPPLGRLNKDRPFARLPKKTAIAYTLKQWAAAANLGKHLTFHMSRHTFATLLVSNDVPLFTASKMLGHANLQTSQRYADVVAAAKIEAIDKLPNF